MDGEQLIARQTLDGLRVTLVQNGFHPGGIISSGPVGICSTFMSSQTVRLHRWDEIALEKVTEMLSRKLVTGEREMLAQIYLKRGCIVPKHSHESEQITYVLQGALKFLIGGEEITVREGEVLHIPSWVEHQAEALDDTFELDIFSPIRQDWLDHTDDYFHR
jgi:quercetin dioxygenase-like cupin family protein